MELTSESLIAGLALLGAIIGVWVKVNSALKVMEKRIDLLEKMVDKQIRIDESIKDMLEELKIGQARLEEKIRQ